MAVLFVFLDQIRPKWIKLDHIGFLTNQKMLIYNIVVFIKRILLADLFWIFFRSDPSKLIKLKFLTNQNMLVSCHIYEKDINGCFICIFGSDPSKMDQT